MTYWLSYGGGVNSTALAILLCEGKLPQYAPWRIVFADTYDERDETNAFIDNVMRPYLRKHGKVLETVCDSVGVLERAESYGRTVSRRFRMCTDNGKTQPINRHLKAHGDVGDVQLLGIDAGESHRATREINRKRDSWERVYPLIDLDIDRDGCKAVIEAAGMAVPIKSGCWHCPFLRKQEVIDLVKNSPDKFRRIVALEMVAPYPQWGDRPATDYAAMACEAKSSGPLFQDVEPDAPCACYDG